MRKGIMHLFCGSFAMAALLRPASSVAASRDLLEGFEGRHYWQLAPWGDEAKAVVSQEQASEGQKSLEIHFAPPMANRGKGIVLERDLGSLGKDFNRLMLDIYNEGPATIKVAIAVETDEYFESQALPLEKGWNRQISFLLNSRSFKSKSSNWTYETGVNLASPLKKLSIIFYREGEAEGTFFLDNMQIFEDSIPAEPSRPAGAPSKIIERGKKNHYRPKGLPIEIYIRS